MRLPCAKLAKRSLWPFHHYQAETLCAKKLQSYASQVQDSRLKSLISEMSNQCQERSQWLSSTLSEAGGSQFISS